MEDAGGGEDDAAGFDEAVLAVAGDFEPTVADEEKLGVGVAMGRVRHLAGREGGLVDFDVLACGEIAADDGAAVAAVGRVDYGQGVEGEEPGVAESWLGVR